ncbi:MAG: DUF1579 family protein [Pseudomonadota bacterium]
MKKTLIAAAAGLVAVTALAGHHEKGEKAAEAETAMMSEEAMMAAMAAAATPGEPHARLAESVGTFDAAMTFLMDPSGEPQKTTMTVERTMDLGGRVMLEHWSGEFMGMPFAGRSRTGYDNVTKRYWSTWTDNWSTGVLIMYGDYDAESDSMVFKGENAHPVTGSMYTMKSVARELGDGQSIMDMYEDYGQGMVKAFTVTMTPR